MVCCINSLISLINIFFEGSFIGVYMKDMDEQILRATKEIIVKFIEAGRISPTAFHESFREIYETVNNTAKGIKDSSIPKDRKEDEL